MLFEGVYRVWRKNSEIELKKRVYRVFLPGKIRNTHPGMCVENFFRRRRSLFLFCICISWQVVYWSGDKNFIIGNIL